MKTAAEIHAAMLRNVDAFYQDRITFAGFSARQLELWKEARRLGVSAQVAELIAEKTRPANLPRE